MLGIPVPKPAHDELGQIARSIPLAARAPARELVPVLEDLAKGSDFDALHGRSMIAWLAQGLSLQIQCKRSESKLLRERRMIIA